MITEFFDVGDVPTDYCEEHFYEPEPVIPEYTYDETIIPEPSLTPENPDENGDQGDGNTDNGDAGGEGNGGDDTGSGDTRRSVDTRANGCIAWRAGRVSGGR